MSNGRTTPSTRDLRRLGADPTDPLGSRILDIGLKLQGSPSASRYDFDTAAILTQMGLLLSSLESIAQDPQPEPEEAARWMRRELIASVTTATSRIDGHRALFGPATPNPDNPASRLLSDVYGHFRSFADNLDTMRSEDLQAVTEATRQCVDHIEASLAEHVNTIAARLDGGIARA